MSPVRVVADDGEQLGVMPVEEALSAAAERGLDLVEVAASARPPVVKIMDYGKFKFEQQKAARVARKKQHTVHVKEVKMRPDISSHDMEFKIRHARNFLIEGNKVKLTMMFRGRQLARPELGAEIIEQSLGLLEDVGKADSKPKLEGRNMSVIVAPKGK